MKFTELELKGAFIVDLEPIADERGFFARSWCAAEFAARGLAPALSQCNISFNLAAGTLRGMHFQAAPHAETKLVRCTQGAVYDVIIDLRPDSRTYKKWTSLELSAANRRALYIPEGFAHGFQTLQNDTELLYQMSVPHAPESAGGVRYDDPAFAVVWPLATSIVSARDRDYPLWPAQSGAHGS